MGDVAVLEKQRVRNHKLSTRLSRPVDPPEHSHRRQPKIHNHLLIQPCHEHKRSSFLHGPQGFRHGFSRQLLGQVLSLVQLHSRVQL